MWRILKFLFTGTWHEHQWEVFKRSEIFESPQETMPYGYLIIQQCKHCGKLKRFKATSYS